MPRSGSTPRRDDTAGRRGPVVAERRASAQWTPRTSAITHDFAAVAYYVGGTARIEQRGLWTVEAGDALVVPAGEPHRLVDAEAPDMWRLSVCVPCVSATMPTLPDVFERVRDGASPVVR